MQPLMIDLSHIPIVDHHAHNLLRPDELDNFAYPSAFTEGYAAEVVTGQVHDTLFFRRSIRQIAAVLRCEPTLEAVLHARSHIAFEALARLFFDAAQLEAVLLDDGFLPARIQPTEWHARLTRIARLLRVEFVAEQIIPQVSRWEAFTEALHSELTAPPANVVGYKSIIAYRTGLAIEPPDPSAAADAFNRLRHQTLAGERLRLADKPLNDWVVWATAEAATRTGLPIQFHTGFGDPDLDLRLANPLHLRPMLERLPQARVVLLHAAYPFTREAGYLTAVYPQVYLDLGLAIPFLSRSGMRFATSAALELAPWCKVLFSTDAHLIPELFYLGAIEGRRIVGEALADCVRDGDLTAAEAETAGEAILRSNALALYRLA